MPIVRVVVKGSGGFGAGASWFTHWLITSTGDFDDGEDLCEGIRSRIATHLEDVLSDAWSVGRMDWTYWEANSSIPVPTQVFGFTPIIGNDAGSTPLAPRQTMLIEYKTLNGILSRKRCYIGRYNESMNDTGGTPSSTLVAAIQSYADNTLGELSVNGHPWYFAVARLQKYTAPDTSTFYAPSLAVELSSHLVQTKWAFLRTRDVGRGI